MKQYSLFLLSCVLLAISCKSTTEIVTIEAYEHRNYDQLPPKIYEFKLSKKSNDGVDIAIVDRETLAFVSGFGLNGKAKVMVAATDQLVIKNSNDQSVKVAVSYEVKEPAGQKSNKTIRYIDFTLLNPSSKSIPLIIPGVMNPNLSPDSSSGVSLKIGQKIYFKKGLKKYLLLEVDNTIKDGDKLDVAQLLKDRKEVLGM